ncbi:MAG: hypothetical protein GY729_17890 [Desulfobacteraceae bacterium]|nr:hypothetical protein [Desulfobacteraceae bacterium]
MIDAWIDIFKGGKVKDSLGNPHDGDRLIDVAVSTFDDSHQPPIVVGHPQTNAPAYGWVNGLRKHIKNGVAFLQAKLEQVNPDFADLVRSGAYKKRSAAFYSDGKLRHVGFLGATPPAIKGLRDVDFNEEEAIYFNFEEPKGKGMTFKSFKELFTAWKATKYDPDFEPDMAVIEDEADAPPSVAEENKFFSEADVRAATEKAIKKEKELFEAEFAEKEAKRKQKFLFAEIATDVKSKKEAGKMPPAWEEMGIVQFMQRLACNDAEIEFAEGSKQTDLEWFRTFISQFEFNDSLFSEFAIKGKAGNLESDAEADQKLGEDIAARAA